MSISILERHGTRHGRRSSEPEPAPEVVDLATPIVLAAVDAAQRRQLSWALSPDAPEGEQVVRTSLGILARYGWTTLHRVTRPGASSDTVTHVAVGPGGVVVVDERLWTGTVCVDGDVLRHNGFRCERELSDLADGVAAVTALLAPEHRTAVSGVVCVATRDLEPAAVAGAHVVGRLHLASLLVSMEPRLTPLDVADVARALRRALDGAGAPDTTADADAAAVPRDAAWLPSEAPSGTVFLPADLGVPDRLAADRWALDSAAYFGSRPQAAVPWATPAAPAVTVGGLPVGQRWRSGAARVTIALLVGLLTFQNSEAIAVAVGDWMGGTTAAVTAAD